MGNYKTNDEMGHQSPLNGYDNVYSPNNWRDSVVYKRFKRFPSTKDMILFSMDLISMFVLLGIIDKLNTAQEVIVWLVGVLYILTRLGLYVFKFLSFCGRNSDWIKRGWKELMTRIFKD